jgi:hypothetical protein
MADLWDPGGVGDGDELRLKLIDLPLQQLQIVPGDQGLHRQMKAPADLQGIDPDGAGGT